MAYKKSKYTRAQKVAYNSGMGYRVAHEGKRVTFTRNPALRDNFLQGYNRAGEMIKRNPGRYPAQFKTKGDK